jgi:exonuclease III
MALTEITKIASLNINAATAPTRIQMMIEHIKRHDLDIVVLQEVTKNGLVDTNGYNVYYNIGPDMRGAAIMAKQEYLLTNITKISSGRTIAADFRVYRFVNIYSPSGTSKRSERRDFSMNNYRNVYTRTPKISS